MPANWGGGPPRRLPFPCDLRINGVGYMMYGGRDGVKHVAAEHPDPLVSAQATEFSYSAQNPMVEATKPYDELHLGFGQQVQQGLRDNRYRYASGVDASIEGSIVLGPYMPTVTPSGNLDTTNGITDFFELGGSLYALNGRYVLKRTADTAAGWATTSKDFTAGKAALKHIIHKQNVDGSTEFAYVAMGASELMYKFDGTTWTQHTTMYALCFTVAGRELYRANGNQVSKCDENADPWIAGNWTAANSFYVGDNSSAIVSLATNAAGILVILKTDGIYILDETGQDTKLYAGMRFIPNNTDNGKYVWLDNDQLHVGYGGQHYEIGPDMSLKQTGPELFADNNSVVHGYITAGVGSPYCSYAGLFNPDSGHSFLMRYGAYGHNRDGQNQRIDAWHGSLSRVGTGGWVNDSTNDMASKKVTAMYISTIGAPALHQQLFIGYSDGTISNIILPCTPSPTGCTSYKYSDGATAKKGYLYFPFWHGGFPNNEKVVRGAVCTAQFADTNSVIAFFHPRTVGSGLNHGTYPTDGNYWLTTVPAARTFVGRTITFGDFLVEILNTASALSTATPVLSSIAVAYSVNPPLQLVMDFEILAEDGLVKRDGSQYRRSASTIQSTLRTVAGTTLGVTVVLPDQSSLTMQIKAYREDTKWDEVMKRWRSVVIVRGIQSDVDLATSVVYGSAILG